MLGGDQEDLRPVRLLQPRRQRLGHDRRGEILVLHVDAAFGGGDGGQMQGLGLAHLRIFAPAGLGARQADRDVPGGDVQAVGPEVPGGGRPGGPGRIEIGRPRTAPSACGRAGRARGPRRPPPRSWSRGGIRTQAPAVRWRRGSASLCSALSQRSGAMSPPPQNAISSSMTITFWWWQAPTGREPSRRNFTGVSLEAFLGPVREEVLRRRHRQGRLPAEDANVELGVRLRQIPQEGPEGAGGRPPPVLVGQEEGVRIEGPVQQVDRPPGPRHGDLGGGEIVLHVDDQPEPRRALHAPAGASGLQQQGGSPDRGGAASMSANCHGSATGSHDFDRGMENLTPVQGFSRSGTPSPNGPGARPWRTDSTS